MHRGIVGFDQELVECFVGVQVICHLNHLIHSKLNIRFHCPAVVFHINFLVVSGPGRYQHKNNTVCQSQWQDHTQDIQNRQLFPDAIIIHSIRYLLPYMFQRNVSLSPIMLFPIAIT